MHTPRCALSISTPAVLVTALLWLPLGALAGSFTEDFTSTTYMDPAHTTANWDTAAGVLELFPFVPSIVGSHDTPDQAWGLDIDGNTAFVADFNGGLQIIDITDPTAPVRLAEYDSDGHALDVTVDGDWVYLADDGPGLKVFDVSDLTNPVLVASWDPPQAVWDVAVSGNHLYVANHGGGLRVLDITDPTSPTEVGSLALPGSNHRLVVDGDYVYVAALWAGGGLHIVDVTDPTNPVLLSTYETSGDAREVAVSGDHVYVADNVAGLVVFDVSDPANPDSIGTYATPDIATGVEVVGDRLYLAATTSGLHVLDVTDPTNPSALFIVDTPDQARRVAVDGEHAFVADRNAGLRVVEVSIAAPQTVVGSLPIADRTTSVAIAGDYAYVTNWLHGLMVVNVSDPAVPVVMGSSGVPGSPEDVVVAGDHAYVADAAGLAIVDVSNPSAPLLVGSITTPRLAGDVVLAGDVAYLCDWDGGLRVVDISDPAAPAFIGAVSTPSYALAVAVAGDHAYIADFWAGLQIVNIQDPTNPIIVGSVDTPGSSQDIAVAGDYAYVADRDLGLQIISIADPTTPVIVGSTVTSYECWHVTVVGDYAYVAADQELEVVDISDPAMPFVVGSVTASDRVSNLALDGEHAYVTVEDWGLDVIAVSQVTFDLHRNKARSTDIDVSMNIAPRSRLSTSQMGSIRWEIGDGLSWRELVPGGAWARLDPAIVPLIWRSTHLLVDPGVNPSCTTLTLEWLDEFAPITAVTDVPDDQGGWLRLTFDRSGYDFTDETSLPVTGYQIYRRVDDSARRQEVTVDGATPLPGDLIDTALADIGESHVRAFDGRLFVLGGSDGQRGTFPPGIWEALNWIGATQSDSYLTAVPTVADSTEADGIAWSVYLTTTHTTSPSVWFASAPDSGYSVDNLAPMAPMNLIVESPELLRWDPAEEEDFAYHTAYGSYVSHLDEHAVLLGYTVEPLFDVSGTAYGFYHVTTSDHAGNVSEAGSVMNPFVSTPEIDALPQVLALRAASPNPARSMTSLALDLPEASRVTANVFDASGARVRVLSANASFPAGYHSLLWDGRDDDGHRIGAGIYFLKVSIIGRQGPLHEESRKVVWMR